jgi:hypothetical protein
LFAACAAVVIDSATAAVAKRRFILIIPFWKKLSLVKDLWLLKSAGRPP